MNDYLIDHYLRSLTPSIETLVEESKPVVTEEYDFEFRHKLIRKRPSMFGTVRTLMQKHQLTEIPTQTNFLGERFVMFLNVTLKKEFKPVVTKKHHFDN